MKTDEETTEDSALQALMDAVDALEAGARGCELIRNYRASLIGSLSKELLQEKAGEEFEYTDHAATLRMLVAHAKALRARKGNQS